MNIVPHQIFVMNAETSRYYIDNLYTQDNNKCYQALNFIKNSIMGSNRQKNLVIANGILHRLLQVLPDQSKTPEIRLETVIILGSLAKGTEDQVRTLVNANVVSFILNAFLLHDEPKFIEACLRCICTIMQYPFIDHSVVFNDVAIIKKLAQTIEDSISNSICSMSILSQACCTTVHQNILWTEGIGFTFANLLNTELDDLSVATLKCFARMCQDNTSISSALIAIECNGKTMPEILYSMRGGDRPTGMRLVASKCITCLYRAGALEVNDPKVMFGALPTLVRLCQNDQKWEDRVEAAEILAVLIEDDAELQSLASISNHLLQTLAEFVNYPIQPIGQYNNTFFELRSKEMKQAAFKVFASLGANDEEIRKKIIETDNLVDHIVMGLKDHSPKVQLAAVRCLHSLSRSVQQLRTTFQDHSVWKPLMALLEGASKEILSVTSSTLCNLLLDFSPSKEPILESGAIELFCSLTKRSDPSLRLNGIWALMNMAFQAEQKIKSQILSTLGTVQMFNLLTDSHVNVQMKTLGLLRNLLSTKPHIDYIMNLSGDDIIEAVMMILKNDNLPEIKEQALCILGNIADGDIAKDYIMKNNVILMKIQEYMTNENSKLQASAIFCISNLVWKDEIGSADRQAKIKEMGILELLQQLITTSDSLIFDKVKTALTQFSDS
ncbi:Armadillo-type fold,Armadillo,Armadillo-like helical [Cinara cedri]|uniref:Armadillo repeat-containing protein 8 n=1 Tax=Cinara cedri TaxID=506608 RepID=A0A5E4NM79_9HEMI|nr:Armadillo-type fold,Armadillo,Armadillo-like helical [Cinara cedri]